jgi:hypothetical protein
MDPLLRKPRPVKRRNRRKPLSEEVKSGYRILLITLIILGTAATCVYLYMNSLKPAKGYTLKQLQIDYEELQSEQRDLERDIIEAQSFINIEEEVPDEMTESTDDDFSYTQDSSYAQSY